MQALQNYLDRMGSNFLVSAMIPSLAFVTISLLIFQPILPPSVSTFLFSDFNVLNEAGLVVFLFTIILGFTLSSLNTFIIKLFEGYVFIRHFPLLRKAEVQRARKIRGQIFRIEKRIAYLKNRLQFTRHEQTEKYIWKLRSKKENLETIYNLSFPYNEEDIQPTRFGNFFKAAEAYSRDRYGIDAVSIWPRLIHVIPDSYYHKLDSKNNQLSFLLNCATLAIGFSALSLVASIYQFYLITLARQGKSNFLYFVPISLNDVHRYQQNAWLYLVASFIGLFCIFIFYRACLLIVSEYGDLVKSTFDLFRTDLIAQFNLKLPRNWTEEVNFWTKICKFINVGNPGDKFEFYYIYKGDKEEEPVPFSMDNVGLS